MHATLKQLVVHADEHVILMFLAGIDTMAVQINVTNFGVSVTFLHELKL